jgi:DNA ligase (NAD+)
VGETVAKKLARHFKSIAALSQATEEELVNIDEIGERIAQSVTAFFKWKRTGSWYSGLKEAGVQMELAAEQFAHHTDILDGNTFVISGVFKKFPEMN